MSRRNRQGGFSLAETLIALGVLTVGMLFVAGVFPVGIHFTYVAIDRTISAAVADEAFAKVRLYAQRIPDVNDKIPELLTDHLRDFNDWFIEQTQNGPNYYEMHYDDFAYPSVPDVNEVDKRYCWSALCRIIGGGNANDTERMVQVTVFVSKRMGPTEKYYIPNWNWTTTSYPSGYGEVLNSLTRWPMSVKVNVIDSGSASDLEDNELRIYRSAEKILINDGYRIVDDKTGRIYRVLQRYPSPDDDIILLDKNRQGKIDYVWVVPPAKLGGRSPCIAVYQKILRF